MAVARLTFLAREPFWSIPAPHPPCKMWAEAQSTRQEVLMSTARYPAVAPTIPPRPRARRKPRILTRICRCLPSRQRQERLANEPAPLLLGTFTLAILPAI